MSDDRDLRDDMVAHFKAYTQSRGVHVPIADLEKLAVSDLTLVDKVTAEAQPAPARKVVEPKPPSDKPSRAATIADNLGYRYSKTALPDEDPRARVMEKLTEKARALAKRMKEMCATAPGSKGLSLADRNYLFPALAKDVIQEHTDFTFHRRRYRGLDKTDRQRAFWRAIEDIADRSTGVLGPWWVK